MSNKTRKGGMMSAYEEWQKAHNYGELSYDYWLGWYEHRRSYVAGNPEMGALDREAIQITSAGRDNWPLHRERAAEILATWPR